jgi:hypothetical protein
VDFIFYTKAKLALVNLLDFPALSEHKAVDPRRQPWLPDIHDRKPGPWSDEQFVSSIRSGVPQQQGQQVVSVVENLNFMGEYQARRRSGTGGGAEVSVQQQQQQQQQQSSSAIVAEEIEQQRHHHRWLPNDQYCSNHFSLRCTFAFDEANLASAGWH